MARKLKLSEAIATLHVNHEFWVDKRRCDAWGVIRAYIKEVQKTSRNSAMLKCPHCENDIRIKVTSA
jgi:hypothetical protein